MSTDLADAYSDAVLHWQDQKDIRSTGLPARGPFGGSPWSLNLRLVISNLARSMGRPVSVSTADGPAFYLLEVVRVDGVTGLRFSLLTDFRPAPLVLEGEITDAVIDVVVRADAVHVELFINGILVDEEWPAGAVPAGSDLVCRLGGDDVCGIAVERGGIWSRLLSDAEITLLASGTEAAQVPPKPFAAYWTPPGHNTGVGDCMPFFHDGRFHLFYLFDRRAHRSKWNLGAHQWAHVSTTDLITWEEHPLAIAITEAWEGSICTGSLFFWEGQFHAFYATRTIDGSAAPLQEAISSDGIHFTKQPPFARLTAPYQSGPTRDPVVFRDEATGEFTMLVTSELQKAGAAHHGGCLARLMSTDLKHWKQCDPFLVPGYTDQPECPDHFEWNGWFYLVFSNHGVARYRMSRSPHGPWTKPVVDAFDGTQLGVLKTASFTGGRRIGAAFLRREKGYAGEVVFRELIQHGDGTLGVAFVPELVPRTAAPLVLAWQGGGDVGVRIAAKEGFSHRFADGIPSDFHLSCRISAAAGSAAFGIAIRAAEDYAQCYELRFEPSRCKFGWRRPWSHSFAEHEREAQYEVAGLQGTIAVELVVRGACVDLCVNGQRTLVARLPKDAGGSGIALFAHDAAVVFSDIRISPLRD